MLPAAPTVTLLLNVVLSLLTSKPAGGVTKIPAVMFAPDTVKLVDADAVPGVVLRADSAPDAAMVFALGLTVMVKVTGVLLQPVAWFIKLPIGTL